MINFKHSEGLIFGIYPASGVGIDAGSGIITGNEDNPKKIKEALLDLGGERPFLVRGYVQYTGSGKGKYFTPENPRLFCENNFKLDLALCYRNNENNMPAWNNFVKDTIEEYKDILVKIQITEEPNNPDSTSGGDGDFMNVKEAIIEGVIAAKEMVIKSGLHIKVGFNAVISFNPNDTFWNELRVLSNPDFIKALDYIGLDFYPGVFRPLPPGVNLKQAVKAVLGHYRKQNLHEGGIPPGVPVHITENGWPTNKNRSEQEQAVAIREIVETVFEERKALNITHYEFFNLRDIDSSGTPSATALESSGNGFQFGLMHDDYTPKPAYNVFKNLIRQFGN